MNLAYSDLSSHGLWETSTGQRSELTFSPEDLPENPYNPNLFQATLHVQPPSGEAFSLPAFYMEPQRLINRGDKEITRADGTGRYVVRLRPKSLALTNYH